jgi:Iron-containing redox enzyme
MSTNEQTTAVLEQNFVDIEYPRLRHCTFVKRDDDSMYMIVGQDYFDLTQEFGPLEKFLEVKSYFDGRHSIKEISERTGVAYEDIKGIVDTFAELGLMRQEEPVELIPVESFLSRVEDSCVMWKRQIGFHRLYRQLYEGAVTKRVFVGVFQETYHYVKSAPKHIATAIAHCKNDDWQSILTEYFNDEYNHSELILRTLENLGVQRERAVSAHPIIGTMSLINMLCEIGRNSTLAYLACTRLFEATQEDAVDAEQAWKEIAARFDVDSKAIEPFLNHMRGDVISDHGSLFARALRGERYIDAKEVHYAVNCLHDLKHSYDQFHDQVIQYYSDISNYVPRLKVDYFSL